MFTGNGNANVNGADGVAINPYESSGNSSSSTALAPMEMGASKI